jgi:hypothetical protein
MGLDGGGNTTPSCGPDIRATIHTRKQMVGVRSKHDGAVIGCLHNHPNI